MLSFAIGTVENIRHEYKPNPDLKSLKLVKGGKTSTELPLSLFGGWAPGQLRMPKTAVDV